MSDLNMTTIAMSHVNVTTGPPMLTTDIFNPLIPPEHIYILPVLIILGIVGNFLSAAIMLRRRFRSLSSSIYLLALAFTDIICLLLDIKTKDLLIHFGLPSVTDHPTTCLLYWWLTQSIPFMSSWLVAAVTVERVIIVCQPLKAKLICTRVKTCLVIAAIVLVFLVVSMYLFALVDPEKCNIPGRFKIPIAFVAIFTYSILPFIVIFMCNMTIVVKLVRQRRFMAKKMATTSGASAQTDTQRLTGMLIANSCVFIILTLPYNVLVSYRIASGDFTSYLMASTVTTYMVTLNHSINFLLYVICGSLYRKELVLMFCPCRVKGGGRGRFLELESQTAQTSLQTNC